MVRPEMTKEYANSLFEYKEGKLFWKVTRAVTAAAGSEAGSIIGPYKSVMVDGKNWRVHRIIFLMHHGYLPKMVDHISTDKLDNRIENLRPADEKTNLFNVNRRKDNTSGVKGVSWDKNRGKWVVRVSLNKKIYQAYVDCFDAACEKVRTIREQLHCEYANHGAAA